MCPRNLTKRYSWAVFIISSNELLMYGENVNTRAAVSAGPNYEMWASLFKNGNTGIVLYLVTNEGESIIVFHKDYAVCERFFKTLSSADLFS